MDDLIRRSDAIKEIMNKPAWHGSEGSWFHSDDIKDAIESVPAVEPKHGEWIISEVRFGNYKYQCKVCGWHEHHAYNDVKPYNFCPHCGAKMKGADE